MEATMFGSWREKVYGIHGRWYRFFASRKYTTLVVTVSVFTDTFIYDLIIPGVPKILNDRVGIPTDDIQLWTSILLAVFGGCFLIAPPLVGYVTDRCSSKRLPFMGGLAVMACATVLFFMGRDMSLLVIARALQGVSAAFIWVSGFSLLATVMGPGQVGLAMGFVSVGMSVGELFGPLVGGILYDTAGHYAVFGVALSFVMIDIVLRLLLRDNEDVHERLLPQTRQDYGAISNPPSGSVDSNSDLQQDQNSISTPGSDQNIKPVKVQSFAFFILLANRRMLASLWAMAAGSTVLTLYVMKHFGWSAMASGFVFVALIGPTLIGPLVGTQAERNGPRAMSTWAFMLMIPLFIGLSFVQTNTDVDKILFCVFISSIGFCLAIILPSHSVAVSTIADEIDREQPGRFGKTGPIGQAYALFNIAYAVGMLVGPAWAGALVDTFGWSVLCYSFSGLSFVSAMVTLLLCGEWNYDVWPVSPAIRGEERR